MRSAASGIWNHSFSAAVNDPAPFGAVCAFAADAIVAATRTTALSVSIDFLNIVMTPASGSHLVGVRLHLVGMEVGGKSATRTGKSRAQTSHKAKKAPSLKD